ncbi:DUF5753 domain-containing protein [Streptomyces sp. NPDC091376]|uniref:DUF5753 domain-containing protein n=1 Tax=Streptomyces sp. NPDC091376 TaxID=3365994 RepID=UPI00380C317E
MAIEPEAIARHSYDTLLIPGLLQTEEYATALIGESHPPLDDETVEERVRARLQRQEALTRKTSTVFNFVLNEASLRTEVGGEETMQRQLKTLLKVGALRNVSIQILPRGKGNGLALNGSMVLLETSEHERYAYVEAPKTSALHSDLSTVSALSEAHGMIRMQALSVEASADFIRQVAEEL